MTAAQVSSRSWPELSKKWSDDVVDADFERSR